MDLCTFACALRVYSAYDDVQRPAETQFSCSDSERRRLRGYNGIVRPY